MGQFFDSIRAVKQNYTKYDDWEQLQADERAKKEYLSKNLEIPQDKVELTRSKAQTIIRATEIMDKYSEDNCEDMEQATGLAAALPLAIIPMGGQLGTNHIMSKKVENIRQKVQELNHQLHTSTGKLVDNADEIKDQIKILEKRSANISKRYPFYGLALNTLLAIGLFASFSLWGNSKQKEASRIGRFQARQKDLKDIKNFVVYTPEQLKQAEEKAKTFPDEKERNSLAKMISELKAISKDKKAYKEWLKSKDPDAIDKLKKLNLTPEQLQAAKEDQELIVDTVKEINIKAEEYSENLENAFDTLGTISWLIAAPLGWAINSVLKLAKVSGKYRAITSFGVPLLTSLGISMTGAFAEKQASRVGRYVARKDLSENPARLMAYSDDDMKKANGIKAPKQKKSVFEKISQSFAFLNQYRKDSSEYKKYKKTVYQQQEKMQKALADVKITDAQRKDAENLQKKVFLAFDEIDEMSQRYSEDVEAGSEIAKNIIGQFWGLASGLSIIFSGVAIAKGKFPFPKIVNSITNIGFKKDSTLRKAINNLYAELKKDKSVMQKFQLSLMNGNILSFMKSKQAENIAPAFMELQKELAALIEPKPVPGKAALMTKIAKELENMLGAPLSPEMVKSPETFIKIITLDKKYAPILNKFEKEIGAVKQAEFVSAQAGVKEALAAHLKQGPVAKWVRNLTAQSLELYGRNKMDLPLGDISNYKTLAGTGVIAGLPILGVIFSVPYMINAWFTNIQKKAGKIGIMKAMEKIDDPKIFANENQTK